MRVIIKCDNNSSSSINYDKIRMIIIRIIMIQASPEFVVCSVKYVAFEYYNLVVS